MGPREPAALARESFVRGALIVSLAGFVSRILGAFYKPIVMRMFAPYDGHHGAVGANYIQIVYPLYGIILSISAYGLNVAISRLVAERVAQGRGHEVPRVFRISLALMASLGLVLAAMLALGAGWLSKISAQPETKIGFIAIAPAILAVSVMAAYRGLFQGLQFMTPYALSQIYEQIARIVTGIILIYALTTTPETVPWGAAGYNFGAFTGALVGLGYLLWIFFRQRSQLLPAQPGGSVQPENWKLIVKHILRMAVPISIIAAVQNLVQAVDSMLVTGRLLQLGQFSADVAKALFGHLGNSYTITFLPPILTNALYVSLIPAITESLTRGNLAQARSRSVIALRLTLLFGIPAAIGIWLFAEPIYLIFGGPGGPILRALSFLALAMMLQQTTSGILQGTGNIGLPVRNFLVALSVKILLTYWWTGVGWLNIYGAAYASIAAFGVATILNVWGVWRQLGVGMDLVSMWVKPILASAAMVAAGWFTNRQFVILTGHPFLSGLAAMGLAAGVYFVALLLIGGIGTPDLELLPRIGRPLAAWLRRLRLLRN